MDQLLSDVSEITRPRWKNRAEAANVYITLELHPTTNALVMGDASELVNMLLVTPSNILNEANEIL